jgi:hypothetical protein
MAIGSSDRLNRFRLTEAAGRVLLAREQKFALDLKEAGFDRTSTTKSPQQAGQPVSERKLDHGSRINTGDEGALECPVRSDIFEMPDDGLVSKAVTPSAAA